MLNFECATRNPAFHVAHSPNCTIFPDKIEVCYTIIHKSCSTLNFRDDFRAEDACPHILYDWFIKKVRTAILTLVDYTSGVPVMAAGCSMPISLRMVGATSASLPSFTSLTASPALITMKGTSLSE